MANCHSDEEYAEYFKGAIGAVEANNYESHQLWLTYAEEARSFGFGDYTRYPWVQTMHGFGECVGKIEDKPIWISIMSATVHGHKVIFWHTTSPVNDTRKCEKWLKKNLPKTCFRSDGHLNNVDANSFTHVFRETEL